MGAAGVVFPLCIPTSISSHQFVPPMRGEVVPPGGKISRTAPLATEGGANGSSAAGRPRAAHDYAGVAGGGRRRTGPRSREASNYRGHLERTWGRIVHPLQLWWAK